MNRILLSAGRDLPLLENIQIVFYRTRISHTKYRSCFLCLTFFFFFLTLSSLLEQAKNTVFPPSDLLLIVVIQLNFWNLHCSITLWKQHFFLAAAMFSLAQFRRFLGWDFRLSPSLASSGTQECVCGSNVQIFKVAAAFVLGKKLQWNRFSKFYLHRSFFILVFRKLLRKNT